MRLARNAGPRALDPAQELSRPGRRSATEAIRVGRRRGSVAGGRSRRGRVQAGRGPAGPGQQRRPGRGRGRSRLNLAAAVQWMGAEIVLRLVTAVGVPVAIGPSFGRAVVVADDKGGDEVPRERFAQVSQDAGDEGCCLEASRRSATTVALSASVCFTALAGRSRTRMRDSRK